MMNLLKICCFSLTFFFASMVRAQDEPHSMGVTFDLSLLAKTPKKVFLSQRSFASMPASFSLEKFCPTPAIFIKLFIIAITKISA